jgi:ABC-type transport system involved in cytochrome bd biosynthesis fused ATPase/permease subunit
MMGGAGSMAYMAEVARKNQEKLDARKVQRQKLFKQYYSSRQTVSGSETPKLPKEQVEKAIADIRSAAAKEKKINCMRSFVVIVVVAVLLAIVLVTGF